MSGSDTAVGNPTPDHKIVLVGMMGAGKSSVGRRVARALGIEFIDLDQRIETRRGRTIREIFAAEGEDAFRDLEEAELRQVLGESGSAVIAAGGGVVVRETNRRLLAQAHDVIWLRAGVTVLAARVRARAERGADHRPLADGDPVARLGALLAERESSYRSVATDIVDVDEVAVDEVASAVVAILATAARVDRGR